jgi:hypothetical protein
MLLYINDWDLKIRNVIITGMCTDMYIHASCTQHLRTPISVYCLKPNNIPNSFSNVSPKHKRRVKRSYDKFID